MRYPAKFQAVIVSASIVLAVASPSAFAEGRTSQRTDLRQMARELERVLGSSSVEVDGSRTSTRPQSTSGLGPYIDAMNDLRARHGLAPLRHNARLSQAAGDRAADMMRRRYFDHVSPTGQTPFDAIQSRGYSFSTAAENLATGYRDASATVAAWYRSSGHRANLLGAFEEVGVAVVPGTPRGGRGGFTVVALYGTPR